MLESFRLKVDVVRLCSTRNEVPDLPIRPVVQCLRPEPPKRETSNGSRGALPSFDRLSDLWQGGRTLPRRPPGHESRENCPPH